MHLKNTNRGLNGINPYILEGTFHWDIVSEKPLNLTCKLLCGRGHPTLNAPSSEFLPHS